MPPASTSYTTPATRRRITALALTLLVHLLLLFLLLNLGPGSIRKKLEDRMPVTFTLMPEPEAGPKTAPNPVKSKNKSSEDAPPVPATVRPPAAVVEKTPPTPELPFIKMSRQDYAAADIGNKPSTQGGGASAGAGSGKSSSSTYGPGEGPGGEPLFDADWYRRPTNAELATYLPSNAPRTGWGLVACKTVENFHVENCQSLGESPLGSGFARAVRQAAWQFLVRPPRIGGKSQVGAWVRIRIDYTESGAAP
ncbi:MAG: hypothetical protein V4461_10950 [Pseudomonadota bacterium]